MTWYGLGMHQSVKDGWTTWSVSKEGYVLVMYVDKFNLVTTGVGNLIDSPAEALKLPWRHKSDGRFATPDEVRAEWMMLKNHPGLTRGGRTVPLRDLAWTQYQHLLTLTLTKEDVDQLVNEVRDRFFAYLERRHFPNIGLYPADAQMAILSMAWACGPAWPTKFGNLAKAILAGDWGTFDAKSKDPPKGSTGAVACAKIRDGLDTPSKADDNVGIVPRNRANFVMFHNAGIVIAEGMDPTRLYFPEMLKRGDGLVTKTTLKEASQKLKGDAARLAELASEAVDLARDERREQMKNDD